MKGIEPLTPSLPWKCSTPELHWLVTGCWNIGYLKLDHHFCISILPNIKYPTSNIQHRAGDETRTRDPQLGRLMLYQLSYARLVTCCQMTIPPRLL